MTAKEFAAQVFDACHHRVIRNAGVCQECFEKALRAHARAALERAAEVADAVYEREHNALPDTRIDGQWVAKHLAIAIRALREEG